MGLDNFAVYGKSHPKYDHSEEGNNSIPDNLFPDNTLCGGLFSGGGNSFRGKVYNDVVEYFTNYTLYEDVLEPDEVKKIADILSSVTEERFQKEFTGRDTWGISYDQVVQLAEWFRVVAKENGSVVSWY